DRQTRRRMARQPHRRPQHWRKGRHPWARRSRAGPPQRPGAGRRRAGRLGVQQVPGTPPPRPVLSLRRDPGFAVAL
ncbi:MAG: hypothetical protein AVDCRST_MAG44-1033, partial [uncultured Sphingomonas sp.]